MLYSDRSLQMGQMGPKMTLGTLTMSGDDFPGVLWALRGSNRVHGLISDIYRRHSDTVYCLRQGVHQPGNGWSKLSKVENKVAINSNGRSGNKISGRLDHSKMQNRPCIKQMHLRYFRTPLFGKLKPNL